MRQTSGRTAMTLGAVLVTMTVLACGSSTTRQAPAADTSASATAAPNAPVEITVKANPDPATTGENTFEAMVMQGGKPVDDASVSAQIFMAAMPAMKMPEMKTTADLKPVGNGTYRGTGQVMMAGNWD